MTPSLSHERQSSAFTVRQELCINCQQQFDKQQQQQQPSTSTSTQSNNISETNSIIQHVLSVNSSLNVLKSDTVVDTT